MAVVEKKKRIKLRNQFCKVALAVRLILSKLPDTIVQPKVSTKFEALASFRFVVISLHY